MFCKASDMSSGILGSTSGLLGPISGGLEYSTVFIQLGLHCNVIFIRINYSDCRKCFGHHLIVRHPAVALRPPRAYIGQIGIFCDIYSIRVALQCNIQSNTLFELSQMFLTASDMSSDILQSASGLYQVDSNILWY